MIQLLLSLINPVSHIADKIVEAKVKMQNAETDKLRIEAEAELDRLQLQQEVLIREQGSWMTRWIRPAFAFPFIVYDMKVIIWDKVLSLGVTDNLSPEFWQLQMLVFGAYFLTRPFGRR